MGSASETFAVRAFGEQAQSRDVMLERQLAWYREVLPLVDERIIDAGANEGLVSEFFATVNDQRNRLWSVEPLAENVAAIRARVSTHNAEARWAVVECAVSSQHGRATMKLGASEGTARNSTLLAAGAARSGDLREVETRTLAEICADATVVKLDIEGHEYEVIEHALSDKPFAHSVKAWAIELHERGSRPVAPFFSMLRRAGYRVFGAGKSRKDPTGPWLTAEVPREFAWSMVAPAKGADGRDVRVIHVVALGGGAS